MARNISSSDAKKLSQAFVDITVKAQSAVAAAEQQKKDIEIAVSQLASVQAEDLLKTIPIEELNRDKQGIKTKVLRENGIETLWDAYKVSAARLELIKGISDESARDIKKHAVDFARSAAKQVKIKLSTDDKNVYTSKLVSAVSVYKNCLPHIQILQSTVEGAQPTVKAALSDIQPLTGGLKWLFTGQDKKEKAENAYTALENLAAGGYIENCKQSLYAIDRAKIAMPADAWNDFAADTAGFYAVLEGVTPQFLGDETVYGLPEELARDIMEQELLLAGLGVTLRRYQELGVKYILHQERVLLGDEMGLGKTMQAIAAMVSLRNSGESHFVVVCPASVLSNWCREITKHSDLIVHKVHGDGKTAAIEQWKQEGGVAVTTFETTGSFTLPENYRFAMLTVDEAHYIKNASARRTVNTKALCAHSERLLFMTGTALENKVEEMISLITVLQPQVAAEVQNIAFMASAPQFREKIAPVYYRRRREDVLTELPEKTETKEWCVLTPEEERIYEDTVLAKKYADIRRVSWNVPDLNNSSKAQRLKEIVEEAEDEGRKVIIFSFFLTTVEKISAFLGARCMPIINGAVPPQRRQEIIDEFEKAPAGSVLIAQIQSGGTGLNIQTASVVVICEPQFKPSIENQAISRAYRMGQSRNVLVYRLLSDDTADEKITQMLEEKQTIFDAFADKSSVAEESLELDNSGFGAIVEEEIARINAKRDGKVEQKTTTEGENAAAAEEKPAPVSENTVTAEEKPETEEKAPSVASTWDCSCGKTGLSSKFCPECGAARPQTWDCACGTKGLKSKFCPDCGTPRP